MIEHGPRSAPHPNPDVAHSITYPVVRKYPITRLLARANSRDAAYSAPSSRARRRPRECDVGMVGSGTGQLHRRIGHTRSKGHLRTRPVVVAHPDFEDGSQVRLGDRSHPVQTLASDCSDQATTATTAEWVVNPTLPIIADHRYYTRLSSRCSGTGFLTRTASVAVPG